VSPYRKLAAFPSFITNVGVQTMLETLSELETARSELLVQRTPQNADVRQLDDRIAQLEEQLYRLATDYVHSLEIQIASADASLARFGTLVEALPQQELEYARLLREARLLNEVYFTLQTRLKEAEVQYAVAPDEVRVIDAALAPIEPVWPRPLVTMILATILGLMLGVAVAVGREAVDTTVRSQWEVEAAAGGLPVVGMIPRMRLQSGRLGRLRTRWQRHLPPVVGRLSGGSERLVTSGEPDEGAGEAFRALRASISHGAAGNAPRVLVLTSPRPGDGKSLSSANLAVSLARQGERILLVDGDLRGGELFRLLGGSRSPGLSEVLQEKSLLAGALQQVDLENPNGASLSFLSSGVTPANPSDLLSSEGMAQLVREMRSQFDRIIIDAPALHQVADGALLGRLADAALLVVRAGSTDRTILEQTVTRLRRMHVPLGGVILNDLDLAAAEYHALPSPFEEL
jgi:tyrosine-protein kinase Etk/Wzc